jgi:hypothetical protein
MFKQVYGGFFCASPSGTHIFSLLCCFRSSKDSIKTALPTRLSSVSPTWPPRASVLTFFPPVSAIPTASLHRSTLDALENVPTAPADQPEHPKYHLALSVRTPLPDVVEEAPVTVPTASSHRSTLDALENVPTAPADQTEHAEYHHLGAPALCFGWLSRNEERKEGSAGGAHKSDAERREPLHRRVYNTLCSNSCVMM